MEMTLYQLTEQQQALENALYENGGEMTPELEAALAETSVSLPAKIDGYNHILARMGAMEKACDDEIKRLQALKKTAHNGQKSLKDHLLYAMQSFNIARLEGSTCKVSRRTSEAVEVADEGKLWSAYEGDLAELRKRLPAWLSLEGKVSKTELKNALKAGELIAGAELVQNEGVVIR